MKPDLDKALENYLASPLHSWCYGYSDWRQEGEEAFCVVKRFSVENGLNTEDNYDYNIVVRIWANGLTLFYQADSSSYIDFKFKTAREAVVRVEAMLGSAYINDIRASSLVNAWCKGYTGWEERGLECLPGVIKTITKEDNPKLIVDSLCVVVTAEGAVSFSIDMGKTTYAMLKYRNPIKAVKAAEKLFDFFKDPSL